MRVRRWHKLRLDDLPRLHVSVQKVLPFIITADYHSAALSLDRESPLHTPPDEQLDLFAPEPFVLTGQL